MALEERVWKAVRAEKANRPDWVNDMYEAPDAIYTYGGLVDMVIEELENEGYGDDVSDDIIADFVFQLYD